MKHKAFSLFFILYFVSSLCFSLDTDYNKSDNIPHGTALCDTVYSLCKEQGFYPQKQYLSSVLIKGFPYNIIVDCPAANPEEDYYESETLILILSQEGACINPDFTKRLLSLLSAQKLNYDIRILFSYETNTEIPPGFYPVSPDEVFLSSIENPNYNTAIFLDIFAEKTSVISGGNNLIAPTWLVKNIFNAITTNRLLSSYKSIYITFLNKHSFFSDRSLNAFLLADIPSVYVELDKKLSDEQRLNFFESLISDFSFLEADSSDTHSIMFTLLHHNIWIGELTITKMILIVIFASILLLFIYNFFNTSFSFQAWRLIKKIWYFPIIIYSVSLVLFYFCKQLILFLENRNCHIPLAASVAFTFPLILAVLSFFFFSILKFSPGFKKRTIDYLTLFCSILNLFVFSILDISLFPIFALEFILAWMTVIFSKNQIHIIILFLFFIPFLPFVTQFLNNSPQIQFFENLNKNKLIFPAFLLVMLPQYLIFFRVLTGMNFYWFDKKIKKINTDRNNLIILSSFIILFEVIIAILMPPSTKKKIIPLNEKTIISNEKDIVSFTKSENQIFSDTITTLNFTLNKIPEFCKVEVSGENSNPVLYTENDIFIQNETSTVFTLPYQPPQNIYFSFGTDINEQMKIRFTTVYKEDGKLYFFEQDF